MIGSNYLALHTHRGEGSAGSEQDYSSSGKNITAITAFSDHFSADTAMAGFNCYAAFKKHKKQKAKQQSSELFDKESGLKTEAFLITSAPSYAQQQQQEQASVVAQGQGHGHC